MRWAWSPAASVWLEESVFLAVGILDLRWQQRQFSIGHRDPQDILKFVDGHQHQQFVLLTHRLQAAEFAFHVAPTCFHRQASLTNSLGMIVSARRAVG